MIARAIAEVDLAIASHEAGLVRALDVVDSRLRSRRRIGAWTDELEVFAHAVAALRRCATVESTRVRARHYFRIAVRTLHRIGIAARGSRLSFLHDDLRDDLARAEGTYQPTGDAPWPQMLEDQGQAATLVSLLEAELRPSDSLDHLPDHLPLKLARARILRMSASFDAAARVLDELATCPAIADTVRWERGCLEAMTTGRLDPLARLLRIKECDSTFERLVLFKVWSYAVQSKAWLAAGRRAATLRRNGLDPPLARAMIALERAYEPRWPLASRVLAVEAVHDSIEDLEDVGLRLLVVGAIARWFARAKQPDASALAAARYHALCSSLSDGKCSDLYKLELPTDDRDEPRLTEQSRTRVAAAFVASYLRKRETSESAEYAEILAAHVSALRGPAMKLGQILAFYGLPIPEPASEVLAALHHSAAAPLPFSLVRAIVEVEHGRSLEQTFAAFDERPLAAGSIGQVHRARRHTGEHVVVKVQYPRIADYIRREFRSLRLVLPLVRVAYPAWDWAGIVHELEARMLEECDYLREAKNQEQFRIRLRDDPRLVIPRVRVELTTQRVMVTEWFGGETFASFVRSAPEAARARAAHALLQYVLRTAAIDRCFNTDMHPGNLLFDAERICLVDFGSVRTWSRDEGIGFRIAVGALFDDDVAAFEGAARRLGMWVGDSSEIEAVFRLLRDEYMGAIVGGGPQRVELRSLHASIRSIMTYATPSGVALQIPPVYVYAFRMFWGTLAVLSALDVAVDYRAACLDVIRPPATTSVDAARA